MIPIVYSKCAGIDIHKKFVTVNRITGDGHKEREVIARTYSTMVDDLQRFQLMTIPKYGYYIGSVRQFVSSR